jgi:hypothetical protein
VPRTAPTPPRRRTIAAIALAAASLVASTGLGAAPAGAGAPPYCDENDITYFVCESYMSFARRTPTEPETDYWAGQLPARKTVFLSTLGKSLESRRRMIEAYYANIADREPGETEMAYWQGEVLKLNGFRRLEAALFNEHDGTPEDLVALAYIRLLGREPGEAEGLYWETRAEADGAGAMAAAMAGTPEARTTRVHWTYQNEMDFFPDVASRDYWAGRLKTGTSYLELRIALKIAAYPESTGICSSPAPPVDYGCDF